jgi:hypothetical protein
VCAIALFHASPDEYTALSPANKQQNHKTQGLSRLEEDVVKVLGVYNSLLNKQQMTAIASYF